MLNGTKAIIVTKKFVVFLDGADFLLKALNNFI
jgi:hypothetical protein